jgi:hypothetical protein
MLVNLKATGQPFDEIPFPLFYYMNNEFRLDRTSFHAMSMQEADEKMIDYTPCYRATYQG